MRITKTIVPLCCGWLLLFQANAQTKRARDYGVTVGQTTLISGDGPLVKGKGPIRTGVTAILPRALDSARTGPVEEGGIGGNGSGDIFIVFSTANPHAFSNTDNENVTTIPNEHINALFTATIEATEEAIVNALFAGKTLTGINGNTVYGMPGEAVLRILKQYNRLK